MGGANSSDGLTMREELSILRSIFENPPYAAHVPLFVLGAEHKMLNQGFAHFS
jgi:hypothetical protein